MVAAAADDVATVAERGLVGSWEAGVVTLEAESTAADAAMVASAAASTWSNDK
jgi:hypothetical protein